MRPKYKHLVLSVATASLLLLGLFLLLAWTSSVARADPGDWFVKPGGSGSACSQAAPCTLLTALGKATDGDILYLAAGTYTGSGTAVISLTRSISLYGGWDGTTSTPPVRDPDAYPTTLDGQGQRRVVYIARETSPLLDGLRITGGNATGLGGDPWAHDAGGGAYIDEAAPLISNCFVYGNTASQVGAGSGGGLYLRGSNATLSGNTIMSNTASSALFGYGGGLFLTGGPGATLCGNLVQGNAASTAGWGYGGGLFLLTSGATLSGNMVVSNTGGTTSRGWGGGLYVWYSNATLSGNTVQGNTASAVEQGYGGGLLLSNSSPALSGNGIVSNTATLNSGSIGSGGGMYVWESRSFTLTNNLLAGNYAHTAGSGLWAQGTSTNATAGRLLHTTIADNRGVGQGVFIGEYSTLAFTNTIVAGHHSVGIHVTAGSTATLQATLWHNNGALTAGAGTVISSTNVTGDPAFVNPSAWDYHLRAGSAAIDRGVDAGVRTDMDGDPRPIGAGYDLGADEYTPTVRLYLPVALKRRP